MTHSADETPEKVAEKIIKPFILTEHHPETGDTYTYLAGDYEELWQRIENALRREREKAEARERELRAENKQHLEKLAEAVALGSTQADRFDIEIDKRDQRITALEKALRGFCDFHEKNASWDKTGEVYYKAMALLPIRFPSPSLSTKEDL